MGKNERVLDCPFCAKAGHLYFNVKKRVFFCFKCGKKGNANELERQGYAGLVPKSSQYETLLTGHDVSYHMGEGLQDPPDSYPLSPGAKEYLTSRGIHGIMLHMLEEKILETNEGLLFLFPDAEYWQERKWDVFAPPRWCNPTIAPTSPAQGTTYHIRTQYSSPRVVLVEGVGDCLRVAPFANCAAMLSSNYHEAQLQALWDKGYRVFGLMFDRDVPMSKRISTMQRVAEYGDTAYILYDGDDPGSADDEQLEYVLSR